MSKSNHSEPIVLNGNDLSLEQVAVVARNFATVELAPQAIEAMNKSRALVDRWVAEGKPIYGINTGFGSLQDKRIEPEKVEELQENIILSHAAGVGDVLPEEIVRAMMLLRTNALAKGYSGIRVEVVDRLLEMLNKRVCPVVLDKGSVGSSGDLAPLAHMTLPLIGRGEAFYNGERLPGAEAMKRANIEPVVLKAKEGLALTNGTQFMTAIGVLAVLDAEALAKIADIAGAMSLEAMKGKSAAFMEEAQQLRPFKGQIDCARNIRTLITGSELIDSVDADTEKKLQDAYSLRCIPQVHGASRQAIAFVRGMIETEINSATDNPLILPGNSFSNGSIEDLSISAGNFHGQPIALSMDFLALALSEIGNISERRVARFMNRHESYGLPPFLIEDAGLNSGMMIAQYAAAALVSENKVLIHPASGDSIPTSANQEDHNSMGNIAARQAREVLGNAQRVLAIELLCAAQALGIRIGKGQKPGVGAQAAYDLIRKHVNQRVRDNQEELHKDIQRALDLLLNGEVVRAVDGALVTSSPTKLNPLV
jgi:histidine ammonia-lyase